MSRMRRAIAAAALGPVAFPEEGAAEQKFNFRGDFLGFAGHFPGQPVLPAVVQVLTAASVSDALTKQTSGQGKVENAKFLLPIGPDTEVTVRCTRRDTAGGPATEVHITVPQGAAASFRLAFGQEPERP